MVKTEEDNLILVQDGMWLRVSAKKKLAVKITDKSRTTLELARDLYQVVLAMNFPMLTIKEATTTIKGTDEYMSKFDKKKYPVAEERYALKIAFKDK
eukprot:1765833-Ditylum_brightwellii.AAC.1